MTLIIIITLHNRGVIIKNMKDLAEVFEKLNKSIPAERLGFDRATQNLNYRNDRLSLSITQNGDDIKMSVIYGGRRFDHKLININEAYYQVKRFHNNKVSIEEISEKVLRFKGLKWYKLNHRPTALRIFMLIFGGLISLVSMFFIVAGALTMIRRAAEPGFNDITIFLFFTITLYAGMSVIINAFRGTFYGGIHFIAVIIMGFGLIMLLFAIKDIVGNSDYDARDITGTFVLFGFMFVSGIAIFASGFLKRRLDDITIKRTAELPTANDIRKIYKKISGERLVPAFKIRLENDMPYYSGSRLGGFPYREAGVNPPVTRDGKEMNFFFQINLSELDEESQLPKQGILQFFLNDNSGYYSDLKVIYFPHVDSLNENEIGEAKKIRVVFEPKPDMNNVEFEDILSAASELGISINPDLDIADFLGNENFMTKPDDYLLGPQRLFLRGPVGTGEEKPDIPLLSISPKSPLNKMFRFDTDNFEYYGFQTFISRYNLMNADFSNVITVPDGMNY